MKRSVPTRCALAGLIGVLLLLHVAGCAQTPRMALDASDPIAPVNRAMLDLNRTINLVVIRPLGQAYMFVMPDPAERGVRNFFRNLGTVHVIANDVLQGEFADAGRSTGRLVINTTIGLGGVLDPASAWGLPHRRQHFGATAARWGLPPGPYLVLPLLGPSTTRGLPNIPMRLVTNPIFYLDAGATQALISGVGAVDSAADAVTHIERIEEAISPYAFVRQGYLQQKAALVRDQNDNADETFDPLPPELLDESPAPALDTGEAPAQRSDQPDVSQTHGGK